MKREKLITETLATGMLDSDKPVVFGVLCTELFRGTMGYLFVAGEDEGCLATLGCREEDIEAAKSLHVGQTTESDWAYAHAVIIVKMKDARPAPLEAEGEIIG